MNQSERLLNLATQFSAISSAFAGLCDDMAARAPQPVNADVIEEHIARRMGSVEFATQVAQFVDAEAVAEATADLIRDEVREQVSVAADDVAQYVDLAKVAACFEVGDLADQLAERFYATDIAKALDIPTIASAIDYKRLAVEIVRLVAQQRQAV
jgi:hypothetical protein